MTDLPLPPAGRTTAEYQALLYPTIITSVTCKLKEYAVADRYKTLETVAMELLLLLKEEWEWRLPTKWGPAHHALTDWRRTVSYIYYAMLEDRHAAAAQYYARLPKTPVIDTAFPFRTRPHQHRRAIFWYRKFLTEMRRLFASMEPIPVPALQHP